METESVLSVVNKNPEETLKKVNFSAREGVKISAGGTEYKLVRDNINGGAVVFSPGNVFCLKWNKAEKKWYV